MVLQTDRDRDHLVVIEPGTGPHGCGDGALSKAKRDAILRTELLDA
jgi:hypothetical protein